MRTTPLLRAVLAALELADAAHAAGAVVHHSLERGVHTAWRPRPTEAEGAKA